MENLADHRILLVNDDGIDAPGLRLLEHIARRFTDDVWVVAPDEEKSGASHSLSITQPVRVRQLADKRYAIKGTPTDCALLAVYELMTDRRPTMLLSGINRGANLAEDLTYSGTAAAAMEGTLLGIPSVAISQVFELGGDTHWDTAERFLPPLLERLLNWDWPAGLFVNINFPDQPPESVRGVRVTTQGQRPPGAFTPEKRYDGREVPYYWIRLRYPEGNAHPDTDLEAMLDNRVSVTPMHLDLTAHDARSGLARLLPADLTGA